MVHDMLKQGESVQVHFADTIFITNKRLIKTNKKTYFQDIDLTAIEGIEMRITHFEMVLRIASSLIILYTLFLILGTVDFLHFLGINFSLVSTICLIVALASFGVYFFFLKRVTKIYGQNMVLKIGGHDWDVVTAIRHHSLASQDDEPVPVQKAKKGKK